MAPGLPAAHELDDVDTFDAVLEEAGKFATPG